MSEVPPWFRMDAQKFVADYEVELLTTLELGACFRLLLRQWIDGHIPDDAELMRRLARLTPEEWDKAGGAITAFFPILTPGQRGRRSMADERERVITAFGERRKNASEAGKRSAAQRVKPVPVEFKLKPVTSGQPVVDERLTDLDLDLEVDKEKPKVKSLVANATRRAQMPIGFEPKESHRQAAARDGVSLSEEFAAFKDFHLSKGNVFKDWDLALHTWIRNAKRFSRGNGNGTHKSKHEQQVERVRRELGIPADDAV